MGRESWDAISFRRSITSLFIGTCTRWLAVMIAQGLRRVMSLQVPVPFGICSIPIAAMVLLSFELSMVRDETWYSAPNSMFVSLSLGVLPSRRRKGESPCGVVVDGNMLARLVTKVTRYWKILRGHAYGRPFTMLLASSFMYLMRRSIWGTCIPAPTCSRNIPEPHSTAMINTVASNESDYTTKEIKQARVARDLQRKLGNPTDSTLCKALSQGYIISKDVVPSDIKRAHTIYGPNTEGLKGRTTKKKGTPIPHTISRRVSEDVRKPLPTFQLVTESPSSQQN